MSIPSSLEKTLYRLAILALMGLAVVIYMGKPYDHSLQAIDSSIHASLALDVTGRGIKPVLPMRDMDVAPQSAGFNDHPFTLFYINGWIMRFFGPDAWSARLLPSGLAVGCVALTLWLGTLLYSPVVGLGAGVVLMTSAEFVGYGARFQLDPAMIFFILLSFIAWWKKRPLWAGVAAGLGVWMKNPVGLLLFPSVILAASLSGQLTWRKIFAVFKSSAVALAVSSLIWIYSGLNGGWEMVFDYWQRQVLGTAMGGRGYHQSYDPFAFLEMLGKRYFPWQILLIASLFFIVKEKRWKKPEVALPLSAAVVLICIISSMRFKFGHYYLPMFPFLALIGVDCLRNYLVRHGQSLCKFLISLGLILPPFLLATPIGFSPEMFPALRKFNPLIQSYGTCRDKVLFIDGHQPYGSYVDYELELKFYTNRPIIESSCTETNFKISKEDPKWVIVAGSNLTECISQENRDKFKTVYQFGNQYLLSAVIDPRLATDLTPLERDLSAPTDCTPAPLPRDRYHRYQ